MNVTLSQVYHSRFPSSPLQRNFDQPFLLSKAFGNRKSRLKVRSFMRRLSSSFDPSMVPT